MTDPAWVRRFRAARVSLPAWALDAPHRCVYATNASGVWQVSSWDMVADRHVPLTDKPTGVSGGAPLPDGSAVVWFDDEAGSEVGRYVVTPFAGGTADPLDADVETGWGAGLALRPGRIAYGMSYQDGPRLWVRDDAGRRQVYRHRLPAWVAGLSRDAALLAIGHTEHGDVAHSRSKVLRADDGEVLASLDDGEGVTVSTTAWSPVPGDARVAVASDATGRTRPSILDVATGERTGVEVDLPGEVLVAGWWPDASAVLLVHTHAGRWDVHRYDLAQGSVQRIDLGPGTVGGAAVRPDGAVWASFSSGAVPSRVVEVTPDGAVRTLLTPPGQPAPPGRPYTERWVDNGDGGQVHCFVATPEGDGPFPLVVEVHGGPAACDEDRFSAIVQAWVDHGYAVALVNYRGSSGFGKQWEDAVIGDPGRPELIDVAAVVDALVADAVADPDRCVITGGSWGGYLTLQALGTQPDRWAAGVAVVPVADYVTAFADESPVLRDYDRTIFGGGPDERPDLFRDRSPITHADKVRAPVLIITGANDTRCPRRQVDNYVEALRARGHDVVYDVFEAGHGSLATEEQIRQQRLALEFLAERLGTTPPIQ